MALRLGTVNVAHADWPGIVLLLAIGLAVAWAAGVLYARHALTRPPRRTYGTAVSRRQPGTPMELDDRFGSGPRTFTEWTLNRADGSTLPVWEVAGDNPAGPTVVLTHGWGDGRIGGLLRLEPFLPFASRLLLWDLPGHGDAPRGAGPCRLGRTEHTDLEALLALTDGPVVLFGWSLGAGVSIRAAVGHPRIIAVAVEAPYTLPQAPASRVMQARGLPRLGMLRAALTLIGGREWQRPGGSFDRAAAAAQLSAPLLVLCGSDDPVCPIEGARHIAQAARARLVTIDGARHNDLWINPAYRSLCRSALAEWLASLPPSQEQAAKGEMKAGAQGRASPPGHPTPAHRSGTP